MKNILVKLAVISVCFFTTQSVWACAVCFNGDPNDKQTIAFKWGMATLLFIVLGVLGIFAKFFLSVKNRVKQVSELQEGT